MPINSKTKNEGLLAYFTMDAGPNVHVICQEKDSQKLDRRLKKLKHVLFTIINRPCQGTPGHSSMNRFIRLFC